MITLYNNNFGSPAVSFKDYQSPGICVLNGTINIDPTNADYLAAQRLELDLPSDFQMIKSAMSSAILMSSVPYYQYGTVLRCWIENNKLCIEKLTVWDSYGNYTIHINSAFVTRGYRGSFQNTNCSTLRILNTDSMFIFDNYRCVITDYFVYFTAFFRAFPSSNLEGYGPFTMQLSGFPSDVNLTLPLVVNGAVTYSNQKGSMLTLGTFENANLTFSYNRQAVNIGGDNSFINFFAVRDNAVN